MKPTSWRRLAIALSVFNVAGAGFAIASGEGWHAGIHVSLALVQQQLDEQATALEDAQTLLANQGSQLAELQERVDFAERMLAQLRDRQKLGSS